MEAVGQLFHLFRDGLDYAFIRLRCAKLDVGRVIQMGLPKTFPDPGAGSSALARQPVHESLQGRASWPRSTPRRYHVAFATAGFTE